MTTLGIIQIIYLIVNLLGLVVSLYAFNRREELLIIPKLFSFIERYLGRVALAIASILVISIFLLAIVGNAVFIAFLLLYGSCSD